MKTRLTALFLAFALVLALLPAAVLTASAETYSGTCGSGLTWTLDTETGVLEISGTGSMENWHWLSGAPWEDYKESIITVIIDDGVTSIGDYAFDGYPALTYVTIGSGVKRVGSGAFRNCTWLSAVYITDIAAWCEIDFENFYDNPLYCANKLYLNGELITDLVILDGVTHISNSAFRRAKALTSVTIPNSVTSIGQDAFDECTSLVSVTIPDSVTTIGNYAFRDCKALTSITIPDSVTSVGYEAFQGCKLTNVSLGSGLTSISKSMFALCKITSITIPDGVTTIEESAFWGCPLTSISIPKSVMRIGASAFNYYIDSSATDVYYAGTEAEWNAILIKENNSALTNGRLHYNSIVHIHSYAAVVTPPTCTQQGYTTHTCYCGDSYVDSYVAALGHNFVNGVCTRCGAKEQETPPSTSFSDVSPNAWYYEAVNYAVSNGLMNGVGNNKFAPDDPMTRAMLVTVLWRYENSPKEGKNEFTDVPAGQWYTDAVAWAAYNGIVGGVGNGKFDPNGNITREQMAAILYRYAQKKGFDTTKRGDLSKFPDAGKVSDWAKEPIAWAVAEGIIGGSDGKLLPQGNATRAQVATILMRFIEKFA